MSDDLEYRIANLEAKPGDVLVFTTAKTLRHDEALRVRASILRIAPGVRALVCDGGAEITLMPADELRKRIGESEAHSKLETIG